MSGRRSHPRFIVTTPWDGAVRVLRDVIVARVDNRELLVISQAPGVIDETMTLEIIGAGTSMALDVKVVESSPAVVDGAVRHRIRLAVIRTAAEAQAGSGVESVPGSPEAV